ncbi:MAG TPA: hypothetical protein DD723_06560 [Candidatus Omnitrophica bacterium]|nr:MAG: hypothetical protein A2Y04_01295 [Omnitrophica WOR_2 bacterium GWC2_45_7]HBO96655.1 hypothetical protein [Candidatus Omnitrophota bacterium]HBR15185.1 hypothetical protein [Candidatus Omnitrophota bacterium]
MSHVEEVRQERMKVEVKKVDPVKRELRFEIPKERVSQKMEEVYKNLEKVAKVKGFRPGKVPRHILVSQYGGIAQQETMKDLIPEVYEEGIKRENIAPIDLPEILDVNFKDGALTFTAKLDIKPEVVVKDYKEIKVKRKSSQVTEEEINKVLEYYKKGQGKEEQVVLDDNFARGLGYPNLEEFKKTLVRQMEMDKDRQNRADIENQVTEYLLSKSKLVVPQSVIKKQLERRIAETKQRLKSHGMSEEDIKKNEEQIHKDLEQAVERDVKAYFILDKIAHMEKIEAKENENLPSKVMEFLLREAKWIE